LNVRIVTASTAAFTAPTDQVTLLELVQLEETLGRYGLEIAAVSAVAFNTTTSAIRLALLDCLPWQRMGQMSLMHPSHQVLPLISSRGAWSVRAWQDTCHEAKVVTTDEFATVAPVLAQQRRQDDQI
jgi:hypothetical protein